MTILHDALLYQEAFPKKSKVYNIRYRIFLRFSERRIFVRDLPQEVEIDKTTM